MAVMVIGVGNAYRRDDGAGAAVARALGSAALPGVEVRQASGEGVSLMEAWSDADRVYLVDAVSSDGRPGQVHRIDARREPVPQDFFKYSTHAFAVAEAVEMARVLDQLPETLVIYGIEGGDFGSGEGLTAAVADAVDTVTRRIAEEVTGGEHA